jgi:serine/threonine protein kinase/tetratricopeptide (TPR) repeat protein
MTDQAQSERAIFLGALEQTPGDDREAYVHQACRDQPELLHRVQQLLSALDQSAGPLDFPPPGLDAPANGDGHPAEGPGTQIGPYKLLEQIGEGGFGVVFMAEQTEPIRRKVALKVLKAGMDTRQVIARFEAERQALALMDHPNIARVLEAGATQSGRPYFVMELVRGIPITDYCDQAQVKPTERLSLFLSVCRAVQHAHQKGIIHRDLKPSNVLVTLHDGTPVAKVIDFGIAKAVGQHLTEKTLFTNYAQMMGTPMYMSPEQAALSGLDIDTRSDVYSLGVLLYELVTGTTPFAKERLANADFDEMRRIIREEEPPPPSTRISTLKPAATAASAAGQLSPRRLTQLFRGELDWVVMKCLSKDRTQRYESASALAADVERYLEGRPIEARPPSAIYRFRKYVRRHGIALTTIGLVTAALLIGIAASTWQAFRATQAKRKAEENYQKARQAVDRYFTIVSQSDLLDEPALQPLRKELLEAALEYYQEFLRERADDRELKVELAAAYFRAGQVCHLIDRNDEAIGYLERCLQLVQELLRDPQNAVAIEQHLAGLHRAGRTLHGGTRPPSDPQQALSTLTRAAEVWERLAAEHRQAAGFRSDLAGFYVLIGDLERRLGKRTSAISAYERAAEILERLVQVDPQVADYRADLASCHEVLGLLARLQGRVADSDKALKRSLALREELASEFPQRPGLRMELASAYRELATKVHADQPTLAQENLERALEVLRRLTADYPGVPVYEEQLARVQMSLAQLQSQRGEIASAEDAMRDALAIFERLTQRYPRSPHYRERLEEYYGDLYPRLVAGGRASDAERTYDRILALQKGLADDFPSIARYHEQLAWTLVMCPYESLCDESLAVAAARRCVELQPTSGNYWRTLGGAYYRAATAKGGTADWSAAIEALEKSMSLPPGPKAANRLFLAMSHWQLASSETGRLPLSAELQTQHREQARELYRQAAERLEKDESVGEGTQRLLAEAAELLEIRELQ